MICATSRRSRVRLGGFGRTALLGAVVALLAVPSLAEAQSDKYQRMRDRMRDSQFQLFSSPTMVLDVNQFQCGLRNQGDTCSNVFNSPTGGGGFWPTGSPNQYMFNAGLNIAGIIPADAGFDWAGDTVAAYFFDATGFQAHGTPLTEIFSSLNADDLANWPDGNVTGFPELTAFVRDADLFDEVLLDRTAASQQDSWVAYWDGDPAKLALRPHPMGILVEQRTLAWNFPKGNESIIYFIYNFTNVTDNPFFQSINEAKFAIQLPDAGWTIDSIYVSFDADPDVTNDFDKNFSTAILPFNMGVSYEGEFVAPDFDYPPALFFPPFFTSAPGMVGIKYLRSPVDPLTQQELGLTMFTIHENCSQPGAVFCDPETPPQLWRYLSGSNNAGLGDPPCTFADPKERRLCFLSQQPTDTRFLQASGPFSLEPGESQTVVTAMFAAATVETPLIVPGTPQNNPPGIPSIRPGCAPDPIRPIEVGAGWVSTQPEACTETPGVIDQFKVDFVPQSLLGKGLVAQTIFDNKFLLGFAPDKPTFFLVPGDNQVSVVWQESATEQTGDPFFEAAGDPENELFNPNYRQFDVEGYRIYRGSSPANLVLIAQFDKDRSVFTDSTCETDAEFVAGDECDEVVEVDIVSPFVQFRGGDVVRLDDGRLLQVGGDTALAAEIRAGTSRPLTNSGIPFAFVDRGVRNGFQYFYKVTAFDINSLASGPQSLESAGDVKSTLARKAVGTEVLASFESRMFGELDPETVLDPNLPTPSIDSETGIFSGPMPPSDGVETTFQPLIERLLPAFSLVARIDSIVPDSDFEGGCAAGFGFFGMCWKFHMTFELDGQVTQSVVDGLTPTWFGGQWDPSDTNEFFVGQAPVPADSASLADFNIPPGFVAPNATVLGKFFQSIGYSAFEGQSNRRSPTDPDIPSRLTAGGSRWFNGTQETLPDPTRLIGVGHLDEADTVWAPIHHTPVTEGGSTYPSSGSMQCFGYGLAFLGRAADVRFTWGGGTFGSVVDVTHNVNVLFKENPQASWGFLNTDANGNGFIDWDDFNYLEVASQMTDNDNATFGGFCRHEHDAANIARLESTPVLQAVSTSGEHAWTSDQTPDPAMQATGTGFGLYINGERYIFEMSSLPGDGTEWTLRTYVGYVRASEETYQTEDPSGYSYTLRGAIRPPTIPGLSILFESAAPTQFIGEPDLRLVHTVPDPFYAVSQFDLGPTTKRLRFVNLPAMATIRIYTVSGVLVDVINHDDPSGGGQATWDLRNRSNQFVASGVYFFHVSTPEGQEHVGKFTIINFAN